MRTTTARRGAALVALLALGGPVLAACSGDDGDTASPTVTVTQTVTEGPSSSGGTSDGSGESPTSEATGGSSTPSGGGSATAFPTDAQAYAQALVDAWQAGDRDLAVQLVRDPDDADELFDDDLAGTPTLQGCEGAAGSSYCTFTGQGYEIVVRVANETATAGQPGAVSDVDVED